MSWTRPGTRAQATVERQRERERQFDLQRELLLAGIQDTQGTIHANDAKCSAALVTHGLLFAGVVAVTGAAASLYSAAPHGLRIVALALGGLAFIAFALSVYCLLRAVRPYRPQRLADQIIDVHRPPGLFFPITHRDPAGEEVRRTMERARQLDDQAAVLDLVCESVKLGAIRGHEAAWARRGYKWLIVEISLVAPYLGAVLAIALSAA